MAYPTGTLSRVLEDIDRDMIALKAFCQRHKDRMAAGNVPATAILDDLYIHLKRSHAALTTAASVPGLADFARAQKNDEELDVVAEFQAVLTTVAAVASWITTNFPKDGNGYLLARTLGDDGPVDRQFTPAQTATLRTALDALIATIE